MRGLKKGLHLQDICRFAIQKLLGKGADMLIQITEILMMLQSVFKFFSVSMNDHIGDLPVWISVGKCHSGLDP